MIWTDTLNATASGSTLQKTGTASCDGCANSGGVSEQQIASGDGNVQFTIQRTSDNFNAGLATSGASGFGNYVNFGGGYANVYDGSRWICGTDYVVGDVFELSIGAGTVSYLRNGTSFCTLPLGGSYPLVLRAVLLSSGATVANARILE